MFIVNRLLLILLATIPQMALAGDGRLELNQAAVDAAGGFPYTISQPGNYVLTGRLVVPADTDGLVLATSDVVFDLNGFGIAGPFSCSAGSCGAGSGMAIRGQSGIAHAHDTTVRNGFLRGFGDNCLRLGSGSYVTQLRIRDCGRHGVSVAHGSLVSDNRVSQTGQSGILLAGPDAAYAQNVVYQTDLSGGDDGAISGGRALVGNLCDDASCSAVRTRRYYVTQTPQTGQQAPLACAPGFHFASFRELVDPSSLKYATELGAKAPDSGQGPAETYSGWIRTGSYDSDDPILAGEANCNSWSTNLGGGTTLALQLLRNENSTPAVDHHWKLANEDCDAAFVRTWCVED